MNDLDLIMALRPDEPLLGPGQLSRSRHRLTAAIAAERASTPRGGLAPAPRSGGPQGHERQPRPARAARRFALTVAVAAAAAGLAAAAVFASGPESTSPRRSATVPVTLTAAQFLHSAARAALRQPANPPRPGQFVYTETEGNNGWKEQHWVSANGAKNGFDAPGSWKSGPLVTTYGRGLNFTMVNPACTIAQAELRTSTCILEAGYFPDLPSHQQLVRAYLAKIRVLPPDPRVPGAAADELGNAVGQLMQSSYLLPAQRAAMFDLMALTPGFTIVHGIRDAIGRTGVGVEWRFRGGRFAMIFQPRTYAYLGFSEWLPPSYGVSPSGYSASALIKMAIVNRAGQLP